ncbi:hypothetical protein [Mycolicibacter senuensis]|uniref:Cullin, a subunit of E3 ubiquitin ligase n=1 Tax=Mycolicibacter senuensis TaxID=386913 RepID=A0A7I9XNF5_9MYCO|nr:hypothetical protein [Mycolicibacter senuensis]MDQ2628231.1 type IV toxin-antitoxin system AbiEi family antitoxin [Actinomycetota bacterium]ORW69331.1 hypothetical protein AWC24_06175 [Mycolicibacter senuensis]GFG70887.1 hypothetical protein MSEN_26070 [Mycolicibacter senuensis]
MVTPFLGSEAVRTDRLTPYALRSRFVAIHPDVYVPVGTRPTAVLRAQAAWLWSRRRGVVAGQSAAALHGAKWVDDHAPAELLYDYRRPPKHIRTWSDRVDDDEIQLIHGVPATTPARTALDLACRYTLGRAVAAIDSLAQATRFKTADVDLLVDRYRGRRGIRCARTALPLVDDGADSPRETGLRLLLIRSGYPPPQTQIPVYDQWGQLVAVLDMGWEEIMVSLDYEGDHHRTTPQRFNQDIRRHETVTGLGWIDLRITREDTEGGILGRVADAWARRSCTPSDFRARFSR